MTVNTAYRHGDYPVAVNGVFAPRVQDVNLDKAIPTADYKELGNVSPAGAAQDAQDQRGSMRWYPINNLVEGLLAGYTTGSALNLTKLINTGLGVPVATPKATIYGAKISRLEYSVNARGEFTAQADFIGHGYGAGNGSISVTAPSGVACYKGKDVLVSVNGTPGVRVSGLTARVTVPTEALFELNNAVAVASVQDGPSITCDIDFYESDAMAGNTELTLGAPGNIVINVASSTKVITLVNMVSGPGVQSQRGTVGGWATRRYSYVSKGDSTTYGMSLA